MKAPLSYVSVLILASAPLVIQQLQIRNARAELTGLRSELVTLDDIRPRATKAAVSQADAEELAALRRDEAELKKLSSEPVEAVDPQELNRLRTLRPELARLRGSIGELRQSASQKPDQLQTKAETVKEEASLIRAHREAKARSRAAFSSIHQCTTLVTEAATITDGTVPRNWNEVRHRILEVPSNEPNRSQHLRDLLDGANGPQGFLAEFEILPTRPDIRLKRGVERPQIPLIREIQPRPQPNGGFARLHRWMKGHAAVPNVFAGRKQENNDNDLFSWVTLSPDQ